MKVWLGRSQKGDRRRQAGGGWRGKRSWGGGNSWPCRLGKDLVFVLSQAIGGGTLIRWGTQVWPALKDIQAAVLRTPAGEDGEEVPAHGVLGP